MDPNTLVSVADIRRALTSRGVSLRGIVDKQDLLRALSDNQLDPYDCVANKNTLSAFIRSHGFLAEFCTKESDLIARAKQVRSICLQQGDYEGLKLDLKTVDTILKARDDYQVLEIPKTLSPSARDVLVAFRNVIRKVHPDKNAAQGANDAAARVNQAFERLKSGKSTSSSTASESKYSPQSRYKHSDEEDFQRRQREAERKWREEDAKRRAKHKEEEERRRRQREEEEQERRRRAEEESRKEEERRQKQYEEERRRRAEERKAKEEEKKRQEKERLMEERRRAEARVLEEARRRQEEEALRRLAAESLAANQGAKLGEAFKGLFPTNDTTKCSSFASSLPTSSSRLSSKRNAQNAWNLNTANQTFMSGIGANSAAFQFGAAPSTSSTPPIFGATPSFGQVPGSTLGGSGGVFKFGESPGTNVFATTTVGSSTGFSFGVNNQRVNQQKTEQRPSEPVAFKFGSSSSSKPNEPSVFKFGAGSDSKIEKPSALPVFKFGSSTTFSPHEPSVFKFGASFESKPTELATTFLFGASSTSKHNEHDSSLFKFGPSATKSSEPTASLKFNPGSSQSSSLFQFGNPYVTLNSSPSVFQLGASNSVNVSSPEKKSSTTTTTTAMPKTEPPIFVFGRASPPSNAGSFAPNVFESVGGGTTPPPPPAAMNPKIVFGSSQDATKNVNSNGSLEPPKKDTPLRSTRQGTKESNKKETDKKATTTQNTSRKTKDRGERIQSLREMLAAETPLETSANMSVEPNQQVKRKIRGRGRTQSLRKTRSTPDNNPLDTSSSSSEMFVESAPVGSTTGTSPVSQSTNNKDQHQRFHFSSSGVHVVSSSSSQVRNGTMFSGFGNVSNSLPVGPFETGNFPQPIFKFGSSSTTPLNRASDIRMEQKRKSMTRKIRRGK